MKRSFQSEAERVQAEVNQAFAEKTVGYLRLGGARVWHPPTDVYETDDSIIMIVEIAGLREGDYELTFDNRVLTVSGQRRDPAHKVAYHQMEIRYGEFRTRVYLPWPLQATDEGIQATYEDGFLRVELRRAEARRVPVRIEGSECE